MSILCLMTHSCLLHGLLLYAVMMLRRKVGIVGRKHYCFREREKAVTVTYYKSQFSHSCWDLTRNVFADAYRTMHAKAW